MSRASIVADQVARAFGLDRTTSALCSRAEASDAIEKYPLIVQTDRHWLLPEILLYLLAQNDRRGSISELRDMLRALRVLPFDMESFFAEMQERHPEEDIASRKELSATLRRRYLQDHDTFSNVEAAAVTEFLKIMRPWLTNNFIDKLSLQDWEAAMTYWSERARTES